MQQRQEVETHAPPRTVQLDTAGDAYIACAALMTVDREGFITLDDDSDPREGAASLVEYAQVPCLCMCRF